MLEWWLLFWSSATIVAAAVGRFVLRPGAVDGFIVILIAFSCLTLAGVSMSTWGEFRTLTGAYTIVNRFASTSLSVDLASSEIVSLIFGEAGTVSIKSTLFGS
jgi:hypothetical protein